MKPRDLTIAEKAKSVLFECGWRQGFRQVARPNVCLVDALVVAVKTQHWEAITDAVQHLRFESPDEAMAWNDMPGRTFNEVLERLDAWA